VGSQGGAGQEERRQGSPRRSGDGGAVGSGRRGGVLVGGRLWRGGGVLEAVLRLATEVRKVVADAASKRDEKHTVGGGGGGIQPAGRVRRGGSGRRATHGVERG
jgi:hypothetical protein